ncbi:ElaB/YqjD/DUF883 family membrane-anchored ribosome-binding protein [Constrictibacter sp. MBR-5]|jgi:hypothetical protein|uniref:DUF3618 domain-containing protein n=1 Tax=Constrictibacter sp. MBR-5 TaxID=3156467 RepID=UPI003399CFD4
MSTDTERLEHEADTHRTRVDSTLDELRARMSVGQIVDEASRYLREGQGGDMVRNVGRQVRDNPLALGLIGAGVAWLLAGEGVRAEARRLTHRDDDLPDDDLRGHDWVEDDFAPGTVTDGTFPLDDPDARPHGSPGIHGARMAGSASASATGGSTGEGISDKAKSAASRAGSALSGAASSTADAAERVGRSASGAVSSAGDAVRRYGHDATDAAERAGSGAMRGARSAGRSAYGAGRYARRSLVSSIQEEPLILGGVALAIGAAIGASFPATRREDALMGPARDRLRDQAYDYGRDAVSQGERVAERAYEAGSAEADRKGLKPGGDGEQGETLAQKVSGVASTAAAAGREEAGKEGGR